jgi:hypothetical protein
MVLPGESVWTVTVVGSANTEADNDPKRVKAAKRELSVMGWVVA